MTAVEWERKRERKRERKKNENLIKSLLFWTCYCYADRANLKTKTCSLSGSDATSLIKFYKTAF